MNLWCYQWTGEDAGAAAWHVLLGFRGGMALRGAVLDYLSSCCFLLALQWKFCIPVSDLQDLCSVIVTSLYFG